jgi:hypothetical protein
MTTRTHTDVLRETVEYVEAVEDLYEWAYARRGTYKDALFDLISKASTAERMIIGRAYPLHVVALIDWCTAPNPEVIFKRVELPEPAGGWKNHIRERRTACAQDEAILDVSK